MLNFKWLLSICCIFVILPANCWSDDIVSAKSSTGRSSDKSKKTIAIQVSSHKKAEDADRELQRLRSHGLEPFIDHEPVKDKGMWYRVYVGPFENRKEATAFAKGLVDKSIISGFWVKKKIAPVNPVEHHEEKKSNNQESPYGVQKKQVSTETGSIILPPPPRPVEESDIPAPSEMSKPKEIEKIAPEETIPEAEDDKIAASSTAVAKSEQGKNKFSMGLKSSILIASEADDFKVTRDRNGIIDSWSFSGTYAYVGLVANLRIDDRFTIESSIEKDVVPEMDIWQFSIGPKYQFRQFGMITPFLRGGLVIGSLEYGDMPGDFDPGLGLDGGAGIYLIKSKVQLGIETSYRWMRYNYNEPSGNEVSATDDHVDMSGLVFSGTLSYLF